MKAHRSSVICQGPLGKQRQSQGLSPHSQSLPPRNNTDMHIDKLIRARHKIPLRTDWFFVLKELIGLLIMQISSKKKFYSLRL